MFVTDARASDGSIFSIPYRQDPTVVMHVVESNPLNSCHLWQIFRVFFTLQV